MTTIEGISIAIVANTLAIGLVFWTISERIEGIEKKLEDERLRVAAGKEKEG